jgi:signal transduction histidine kinase
MVILDNLISNSIKYYDKNKTDSFINISATENEGFINLTVEDNGIGISEEHHNRIFDMFYRATNHVKGTGLGLSIVKAALEKMGGSISLASEYGKGCKFTIKFPNLHRI